MPSGVRTLRSQLARTHSGVPAPASTCWRCSSLSGPKYEKFIAPWVSRFSRRPSRPMPTASPNTRSVNSSAMSCTRSTSSAPRTASVSSAAYASNPGRSWRILRGAITEVMAVRIGVWRGGSDSRMPWGRQFGVMWRLVGPTPALEMNVSWSTSSSRMDSKRVKACTPYCSSHTAGPASRIRSNSGYGSVRCGIDHGSSAIVVIPGAGSVAPCGASCVASIVLHDTRCATAAVGQCARGRSRVHRRVERRQRA